MRSVLVLHNLSVIIPYHNGQATLTALLDSLPSDLPVVVVDDVSEHAPTYIGKQRQVSFLQLPTRSYFAGAVNAGIAVLPPERDVLILNQDVTLSGEAWQTLIDQHRAEYALIGDGVMTHPAWPLGYVQGTFMFVRRDAWKTVGPFNAELYPLWGCTAEWQLRACRQGFAALPVSPVPGLVHARGTAPFGSAIKQTLADESDQRERLLRIPPLISVIIPCHNYGRYLTDAVRSLLGGDTSLGARAPQTLQSFEVIIVNDGSSDDTEQIGQALANAWQGVRYLHRPARGGTALANNTGLRAAFGKYVTFLSADDMMRADRLAYLYQIAQRFPNEVLYDDLVWFKHGQSFYEQHLPEYDFENLLGLTPRTGNFIPAGIFLERRIALAVGGYPAIMANGREDWAMNIRLGRAGYCGRHVGRAGYLYRREGQNRTLTNTGPDWRVFWMRKLHELFPDLYRGERPMGCCGGGRRRVTPPAQPNSDSNVSFALTDPGAPAGMTRIAYQGGNLGSQEWRGVTSHRRYLFNAGKRRYGWVDTRDLETGDARRPGLLEIVEGQHLLFSLAPVPAVLEAVPA